MQKHRWFPFLIVGLLSVLIGLFFFIFDFQQHTRTNTQNATLAFDTGSLYQQASYLAIAQELDEQKYLANPTPVNYSTFQSGSSTFTDNLRYMLQESAPKDRAALLQILMTQQQYQQTTQQMVTALQANQVQSATQIDDMQVSPLYLTLQNMMDAASTEAHSQALAHMDEVVGYEDRSSFLLPFIYGIGFVLLVVIGVVLYHLQHSLGQAQQREIDHFKQSSLTDNLTQLGNHRAYQEAYHREITHAQQHNEALCLALIDVDEFKQYNDQHGHAYGDHILKTLAHVLSVSRAKTQAFRLGGDEFAIILPHTMLEEAMLVLEHVRESVQQQLVGVTISIGIAVLQPDASNARILQEQTDAALYEAKHHGRNRLVAFPEIKDEIALLTSVQTQSLRDLLQEKLISIVFQPIWDLDRNEILAFEALMRPDAKYHFSGAQEAFDVAERMGHVHTLDMLCWEAILARAHELPANALLFMNISPQTLEHAIFGERAFFEAVTAVGMAPERIVLEITERSILRPEVVVREAKRLRNQGFKLALDDAGVGNSGLEMLSHLAMDYVKIDHSIISQAPSDTTTRAVLAGIAAIARETNSFVIAEGIEDTATLEFIRQFRVIDASKVHGVQGYLLGQPSEEILDAWRVEHTITDLRAA